MLFRLTKRLLFALKVLPDTCLTVCLTDSLSDSLPDSLAETAIGGAPSRASSALQVYQVASEHLPSLSNSLSDSVPDASAGTFIGGAPSGAPGAIHVYQMASGRLQGTISHPAHRRREDAVEVRSAPPVTEPTPDD